MYHIASCLNSQEYYSIIDSIVKYSIVECNLEEFNRVILGIPVSICIVGMMLSTPFCTNEYIISHVVQKKLDVIKNYSDILAFDLCSKVYAFCINQFSYCKILRLQVAKGIGSI